MRDQDTSSRTINTTSPQNKGDLNAAWLAVDRVFDTTNDGLNIYEAPVASALADTLESTPRFEMETWSNIGLLSLKNFPNRSNSQLPKVFGVTDDFVEALDRSTERAVMVYNRYGELWRTLHTFNARGYDTLSDKVGSSDLIVEGTKLSESERTMLNLWARRHVPNGNGFIPNNVEQSELQPIPHTSWLMRLVVEPQKAGAVLVDHLRDCGVKVVSTAEQPARLFNEKLEEFIDLETTRHKTYGDAYTVDRTPFAGFTERLQEVYRHLGNFGLGSPILMALEQNQLAAAIINVYRDRLYTIGADLAKQNEYTQEKIIELIEKIDVHLEESSEMLNIYAFSNEDRSQPLHENNAVLIGPEFVETLWQTMGSRFDDEVVLASPQGDYEKPYSVLWYGGRFLLTFVPSTVANYSWLHIDTLPPTEVADEDVSGFRKLINKQLRKDIQ